MRIPDFLSQDDASIERENLNKTRLLKELSRRAATHLAIDGAEVAEALLKREALGSTGMGAGVAIPHARIESIPEPFGMLARLKQPIEFDAIDGEPVDVVFLLLVPTTPGNAQLDALACVARKLRNPETVSKLRMATDSAALYQAMVDD
jgi:PTS system nitrogen regulatory IIA component